MAYINGNEILFSANVEGGDLLAHNADANAHEALFNALKDRITALEGGTGTGTIYFYKDLADEVASYAEEDYEPFELVIDGQTHILTSNFFANKCTYVNFGGTTTAEERGAYLYFYKKSVELAFYEVIDVYANGEWISGVGESYTYTAPEDVHITLHE